MPDTVLLPGIHLKAALYEDRASLDEKLAAELSELVPCVDIDEHGEVLHLPVAVSPTLVDGEAEASDFHAARSSRTHVWVARQVTHQNYLVEGGHLSSPVRLRFLGDRSRGRSGGSILLCLALGARGTLGGDLRLTALVDGENLNAEHLFDEVVAVDKLVDLGGIELHANLDIDAAVALAHRARERTATEGNLLQNVSTNAGHFCKGLLEIRLEDVFLGERLRHAGIKNISIDLMYGFPGETLDDWERDIEAAITLNVEHLSAYCLMIEEGTPLYQMQTEPIDEELERQMYYTLIDHLEAAGYEHYEISNFARPGYRSHHNSNYWNGTPYIGLGAAAHSYDGQHCRRWNVSDIHQFIEGIENEQPCFEQEQLDDDTRYNDIITTFLRTREGLNLDKLSVQHRRYCLREAQQYIDSGLLRLTPDRHLSLTREGLFVSDMVMSALILA